MTIISISPRVAFNGHAEINIFFSKIDAKNCQKVGKIEKSLRFIFQHLNLWYFLLHDCCRQL